MDKALGKLREGMEKAAMEQDFERAAYLRDRIKALQKMIEGKDLTRAPSPRRLAEISELKKVLKLKNDPMRIEAFDVSNIQGSNIVGAMVAFYGGLPLKNDYRRFKIKSLEAKPNDVAAIYEIVKRRYSGSLSRKMPLPDLVMVDGGLAQVNSGARGLKESRRKSLPIIGLAKREEKIYRPKKSKPLLLARTSSGRKLLQRIRDEAHRFAVAFHREKRKKALYR
jgi:excinuclease ABC subunit C